MGPNKYYFADYVGSPDPEGGREPRMPDEAAYLQLLEPGRDAAWGIFAVDFSEDAEAVNIQGFRRVEIDLECFLMTAEGYPPALALTRRDLSNNPRIRAMDQDEFSRAAVDCLRDHLRGQRTSGFFLAEALSDQVGYLRKGGFYWIIGYDPDQNKVNWVSDDYHVYTDSVDCFRLTRDDVLHLIVPGKPNP